MGDGYKEFACEYPFEGGRWAFHIIARDRDEAQARLRALAWAKCSGPVVMTVRVAPERGFIARMLERVGALFR